MRRQDGSVERRTRETHGCFAPRVVPISHAVSYDHVGGRFRPLATSQECDRRCGPRLSPEPEKAVIGSRSAGDPRRLNRRALHGARSWGRRLAMRGRPGSVDRAMRPSPWGTIEASISQRPTATVTWRQRLPFLRTHEILLSTLHATPVAVSSFSCLSGAARSGRSHTYEGERRCGIL